MKCPVCEIDMITKRFGDVEIDVCEVGCKGLWFDAFELVQLDESHEGFGRALDEALISDRKRNQERGRIDCPKCSIKMQTHKYKALEVFIDECYSCGGKFLDAGELKEIRAHFKDDRSETLKKVKGMFARR